MSENLFVYGFSFDLVNLLEEEQENIEKENEKQINQNKKRKRSYEVRVVKEQDTTSRLWIVETFHGYNGQDDEIQLILKADKETIEEERERERDLCDLTDLMIQ
jgi:hypothetical protein